MAIGDTLVIVFGNKTLTVKVAALNELTKKEQAGEMYTVVDESYKESY